MATFIFFYLTYYIGDNEVNDIQFQKTLYETEHRTPIHIH